MKSEEWQQLALCRPGLGNDPELFFTEAQENTSIGKAHRNRAKRICHRCSVKDDCLEYALRTRQMAGVWGGMTENERAALIRAGRLNASALL